MVKATECLKREHADLEKLLDELAAAIRSGGNWGESLRRAAEVCAEHYRKERYFLERFATYEAVLAARIEAQHAEACELAQRFEEAVDEGHDADALSLARRFHAIAQHNVIQEERDVFPLANRCFTEAEQQQLLDSIGNLQ